ncbi:hypothetical protein DICVIV_05616 [Dictyocaulus viviparus]|uniref:Prolyl 4-hydroxylase N-terminal domain-containing protein n=1 Tax=Dictyocaulus viviparus TaxID=29172 RepID=A0A0D8XWX7_DICVI|nr:hypothetical protein DICVIV_05616 [Dictyocaulus viviparus]
MAVIENICTTTRFADEYIVRNKDASDIGPDFVTNPINAYLLIKRLTSEWKKNVHVVGIVAL